MKTTYITVISIGLCSFASFNADALTKIVPTYLAMTEEYAAADSTGKPHIADKMRQQAQKDATEHSSYQTIFVDKFLAEQAPTNPLPPSPPIISAPAAAALGTNSPAAATGLATPSPVASASSSTASSISDGDDSPAASPTGTPLPVAHAPGMLHPAPPASGSALWGIAGGGMGSPYAPTSTPGPTTPAQSATPTKSLLAQAGDLIAQAGKKISGAMGKIGPKKTPTATPGTPSPAAATINEDDEDAAIAVGSNPSSPAAAADAAGEDITGSLPTAASGPFWTQPLPGRDAAGKKITKKE